MLYSFDVFDTLITRRVATPDGIFAVMREKLILDASYLDINAHVRNNFHVLRKNAERKARALFCDINHDEISMKQIYKLICTTGELNATQTERLIELEKRIELENIIGIPYNIERYFNLIDRGERVVLISDMYLDKDTVSGLLTKVDERFSDAVIYMSSEYQKSKSTGRLYSLVANMEGVLYEEWEHYGDNPWADVEIPSRLKIRATGMRKKELLPIESHYLMHHKQEARAQYIIGASANARIMREHDDVTASRAYEYGTALIAPIAVGYISWVLERAIQQGVSELYFIARDGYLLKATADRLITLMGCSINTHYIHGSRRAWRCALFGGGDFEVQDYFRHTEYDTGGIEAIAERFDLSKEELIPFIPTDYMLNGGFINPGKRQQLAAYLQENSLFKQFLFKKTEEKRALIANYLMENIDTSAGNYAFIELVGSGYTQYALSEVLKELTDYPTISYFYHMDGDYTNENCIFYCYNPGSMNRKTLEPLFNAPHGSTEGYERKGDGKVEPVLGKISIAFDEYNMIDFQRGFFDFLENLTEFKTDNIDIEESYIRFITETPDEPLRAFIGDSPFDNSGKDKETYKYAPKLTRNDLDYLYRIRLLEPMGLFYHGADFQYSLDRLTDEDKVLVERFKAERDLPETQELRFRFWENSPISWVEAAGCGRLMDITGRRIALYGAGVAGRMLEGVVGADNSKELAVWVDRDYEKLQKLGWNVMPVEVLYEVTYDSLVISVAKETIAKEIRRELIAGGVSEEKIHILSELI